MELTIERKPSKNKNIIATFNDNSKFIAYENKDANELYNRIINMDGEKIKKLIKTGEVDYEDVAELLDRNTKNKKYMYGGNQRFVYPVKDVMVMPTLDKEREMLYVFGVSGSGKSYFSKKYAKLYLKYNKGNEVFIISHVEKDPSFEGLKYTRIPIENELFDEMDLNTFENSLVIFDDTDTPKDKELQKKIDAFKDDIAQRGRHTKTSAIFTTHMACNYNRTRVLLSECDKFVIFPGSGGKKQQENMVINHGGLDKRFFNSLTQLRSRWVCINIRYPNYIVFENGVELVG